jgi:glycosyl hydrolase family 2
MAVSSAVAPPGPHRYYGWYVSTGDLANAEPAFEAELTAWAEKYDEPIIMTEYGGDTQPGSQMGVSTRDRTPKAAAHHLRRRRRTEEAQGW